MNASRGTGGSGRRTGTRVPITLASPALLAVNRITPVPTRTPLRAAAAADPWLVSLLLSLLLAFGIPALALLGLVTWEGRRYPAGERAGRRSRRRAAGLLAAAAIMALSALLLLLSLAVRLGKGGLLTRAVPLAVPVVYLGLSSLVLSQGAARGRRHPLLAPLHLILAVLVLVGLAVLYAMTPIRKEVGLLTLAISVLASAFLVSWPETEMPVEGPAPAPAGATILSPAGGAGPDRGGSPPSPVPSTRFPPELEGRFRNAVYLGGGGVAQVYRARMEPEGREVVVKIPLRSDEATGRSFLKEIRAWEELRHPRIVAILSANILPVPYVVMEYCPRSLDRLSLPLTVPEAAHLVAGILEGLAHAHGRGIIHRDLKPQNILLGEDGEPRIADWGLSTVHGGGATGTVAGFSLAYAAPEQIAPERFGGTDPRTDLYQAGVLFYELVTGTLPFAGGSLAEQTRAILEDTPSPPSSRVPSAEIVDGIILRCLEKEKSRRYRSAEEMAGDLATAMGRR